MDMSIGEFEQVGEVVKSFTSEDATVVVGTVIDPDMSNELRVTVVATGLGTSSYSKNKDDASGKDGATDYKRLDRPTVMRRQAGNNNKALDTSGLDYLDIPAFLRKQVEQTKG
jgi:cell division protein FtsZ